MGPDGEEWKEAERLDSDRPSGVEGDGDESILGNGSLVVLSVLDLPTGTVVARSDRGMADRGVRRMEAEVKWEGGGDASAVSAAMEKVEVLPSNGSRRTAESAV